MAAKKLHSWLAATGLALLLLVAGPGGPATSTGPERAAAAECTWQRHKQRVVTKVKRHGKLRRVVRFKPRWSCVPVAATPASSPEPAAAPPPPPAPQPGPEEETVPRRVSVKASDDVPEAFSFGLSRPYVVAGEVTIELNNSEGGDPHNLNLRPEGTEDPPLEIPEAGPGERRLARFELPAGKYRLWCSLPQHEEWGMSVALEVRGS
jgi:hypothetical protein